MSDFIYELHLIISGLLCKISYSLRNFFPKKRFASNGLIKYGQKIKVHTHDPRLINSELCKEFCNGSYHGRIEIVKHDKWGRLNTSAPLDSHVEILNEK